MAEKSAMKRSDKQLVLFFIITLLWTWGFGFAPVLMGIEGTSLGTFLFYFGGGAPSVTALFIVFISYTKEEKRDYFKRCFIPGKTGIKWILLTAVFFALLSLVTLGISVKILGYEMPGMDFILAIISNPLNIFPILLISIVSGPLNEEFGWRGLALDRLFVKYKFIGASLLLGFIWGIWHLAWYFTPGQAQYDLLQSSLLNAVMYIPGVMLLSVAVSFVYVKTNRNIMAAASVHMFSNLFGSQLLAPYSTDISLAIRYSSMLVFLCLLLYCAKSKKFKAEFQRMIETIHLT